LAEHFLDLALELEELEKIDDDDKPNDVESQQFAILKRIKDLRDTLGATEGDDEWLEGDEDDMEEIERLTWGKEDFI